LDFRFAIDGRAGMNDAPEKRPWFQYHLSTAIVLMFVTGGLMWPNLQQQVQAEVFVSGPASYQVIRTESFGWPFRFRCDFRQLGTITAAEADDVFRGGTFSAANGERLQVVETHIYMYSSGWLIPIGGGAFLVDMALALGTLALIAIMLEWHIRRRERRP
jgi:hypothetical protein